MQVSRFTAIDTPRCLSIPYDVPPRFPFNLVEKGQKIPNPRINRNDCHRTQHSTTPQRTQTDPSRVAGSRQQQGCDRNLLLPQPLRNSVMRARNGERALLHGAGKQRCPPQPRVARRDVRGEKTAGRRAVLIASGGAGLHPDSRSRRPAPGSGHAESPRLTRPRSKGGRHRDGGAPRAASVPSAVTSRWAPPAPSRC